MRLLRHAPALTLLAFWAGCGTPPPPPDPDAEITAIETQLQQGDAAGCLARLVAVPAESYPRRLRDRHDLLHARAAFELDDTWGSFEVLEKFADKHPHSELRPKVEELLWKLGQTMAASGRGFLFFWSDRHAARTVLEHLTTHYPECPQLADSLRLLGDIAYEDGYYTLAQERFRDLMRRRPDSEWVVYARYRFAMSIVATLKGPEYDLAQMEHASRELQAFLAGKPEQPEFVQTASEALHRLVDWRATRHLSIAHYYRTLHNDPGQRYHLGIAAGGEFFGTAANQQAIAELSALPPPPPPTPANPPKTTR